jgi:HAMP domain-containing protein
VETPLLHWSTLKNIGRFFLFFFLFCFIPVGIACFLGVYSLSRQEDFHRQNAAAMLEKDVNDVIRHIDPHYFLENNFSRFSRQFFSKPANEKRIRTLFNAAQKKWFFPFELYVFDQNGVLSTPKDIRLRSTFVLQKVWDILVKTPRFKPNDSDRFRKTINTLMGSDFHFPYLADREGKVFSVRAKGADGVIFWQRSPVAAAALSSTAGPRDFSGIILMVWNIPRHSEVLQSLSSRKPYRGMSLAHVISPGRHQFFWDTIADPTILPPNLFQGVGNRWQYRDDCLWFAERAGDLSLIAGRREPGLDLHLPRQAIILVSVFLCLGLSLFWYRWVVQGKHLYVSIRVKLILLFIFAIIVPMMGIAFLGFHLLRDRENVLVEEKQREARDVLNTLDTDFVGEQARMLSQFRSFRHSPDLIINPKKILERAVRLVEQYKLLRFEIRDITGKVLITTENQQAFIGLVTVFEAFAKLCIERNLPERWNALKEKPVRKFDMLTSMIFESPEMGLCYIVDRPDMVHPLTFGTNDLFWYWDVYDDPSHPLAFITLAQSLRWAIPWFLKARLKSRFGMFRVFACRHEMGTWYPEGFKAPPELQNLMDRTRISMQPVMTRLLWRGRAYHAVGIPGNKLKGYILLALFGEEEIRHQVQSFRDGIIGGMCMALLVTILTGAALSQTFLAPIGELSNGLIALGDRRTDYRVPVGQRDELGDLSETFNQMMAELKEIHMAKIVQDSLLPQQLPVVAGYEFTMTNFTASDLGGDYFDALPMKDGRMLFVIGDVTGHGASSALLMAMAKAVVFEFAVSGDDLFLLLKRLNTLIFHVLQRKKFMTLFAGILNPETGEFRYSIAGHPYPLLVRMSGQAEYLKMIHFPLGRGVEGRGTAFQQADVTIEPGEYLFMYTDGLVESVDRTGTSFGYDRLEKLLVSLRGLSGEKVQEGVLQAFYTYRGRKDELEDDLTIGLIRRLPIATPREGKSA